MKTAIFYKTYLADAPWLRLSLRSLVKFAVGFEEVVVVSDNGEPMPPIGAVEKHFYVTVPRLPYSFQQVCKVNADAYTNCRFVMYMDADVCLARTLSPYDIMIDGLPVWLLEKYDTMSNPDVLARRAEVSKFIGRPVEHEFMRRHPFIIDREALVEIRRFCWRQHGCSLDDYMMNMAHCSEFNLLGCFQYEFRRETVAWRRPDEMPVFLTQKWSHGGLTNEIKTELEAMLA